MELERARPPQARRRGRSGGPQGTDLRSSPCELGFELLNPGGRRAFEAVQEEQGQPCRRPVLPGLCADLSAEGREGELELPESRGLGAGVWFPAPSGPGPVALELGPLRGSAELRRRGDRASALRGAG